MTKTTRETLDEELETIEIGLRDNGFGYDYNEAVIRRGILKVVEAALEESGGKHGLETKDYDCAINKSILQSLQEKEV